MLCISEVPTSSSTAHSSLENVKRAVEKILCDDRRSAHKAAYLEAIKAAWIVQRNTLNSLKNVFTIPVTNLNKEKFEFLFTSA